MTDVIKEAYYNPSSGFVGIEKLYRKLKKEGVKKSDIRDFLARQEVYQINKKNNKRQGSFIPRFPLQEFQIDLIYIEHKHLNKAAYGLCCIDAFTKKADIELMKKKTKEATVDAMMEILERMGIPKMIYCDEGSEFNNAPLKRLCNDLGVELKFTIRHAPIVERFNRTIKEMLNKYLQSTDSKTITTVLDKMVSNYNNSFHSTIGMAPNEVDEDNMHIVQMNLIAKLKRPHHTKLKEGDKVRVQVKPKSFVKGYKPKYSKEIYDVEDIGNGYVKVSKDDRRYLRGNLMKVAEYEINPEKPDLKGTREGLIREIHNMPKPEYDIKEEAVEEKIGRRRMRERKPSSQVEDTRYGRINWR